MKTRVNFIHFLLTICILSLSGCTSFKEYASGILAEEREDLVVYKRESVYDDTQFDLEMPPDLINPTSPNSITIPELAEDQNLQLFTVDTQLKDIKLVRTGRDSYLTLLRANKEKLWLKLQSFWREEGFRIADQNIALGVMKTDFLENLSEAQLGTIQRVVGRYVPLLVSPDTRDSYKTRLVFKDESTDIIITHYGKEYMTDGDDEFRWQNRARDPELETEMISRLYIYLGGEEAKGKGLVVVKSTGLRNKSVMNVDENGLHTLFVADTYERVYPRVLKSLEILGIGIVAENRDEGLIQITLNERGAQEDDSFFDKLNFWSDDESEVYNVVLVVEQLGTTIEVQNESFVNVVGPVSEEVIRGLHADLR